MALDPILERVRSVELELHSFCPKRCAFCVNSFLDRDRRTQYLPDEIINDLIRDLVQIPNIRRMAFHRYNEPFINKMEAVKINSIIDKLKRHTNLIEYWAATNLVFLSERNNYLRDCDLNFVTARRYDPEDPGLTEIFSLVKIDSLYRESETETILFLADGKIVFFEDVTERYSGDLYDRGGSLPHLSTKPRIAPCNRTTINIGIDFNGNVMPCPNMQSQVPSHAGHILGNLHEASLISILKGGAAQAFFEATAAQHLPQACLRCQSKNILRRFPTRPPWCTCGRSKNAPYCDGSHKGTEFRPWFDPGE